MELVQYAVKDRVGFVTLNRAEKRNALSFELVSELSVAFTRAESDPAVKIIVLCAAGDVFCAGADLAYLQKLQHYSFEENLNDSKHLKDLFLKIYTLKKVVIAQVQGHALAGGCGLTTVCDIVFAVPEARFGYTEVRIGFVPAMVMVFLLRKIGEQKAKQLLLSGELVAGDGAVACGLVNFLAPKELLESSVMDFAQKLVHHNSLQSMELTKKMIAEVQSLPLTEALDYAAIMNARARMTEDCRKGVQAFLEKRDIDW
jgi:methylglutaconyl-CoA hydratase